MNFPTTSHGVALEHVAFISDVTHYAARHKHVYEKNKEVHYRFRFILTNREECIVECGHDMEHAQHVRNEAINALSTYHTFKELLKACRFYFEA